MLGEKKGYILCLIWLENSRRRNTRSRNVGWNHAYLNSLESLQDEKSLQMMCRGLGKGGAWSWFPGTRSQDVHPRQEVEEAVFYSPQEHTTLWGRENGFPVCTLESHTSTYVNFDWLSRFHENHSSPDVPWQWEEFSSCVSGCPGHGCKVEGWNLCLVGQRTYDFGIKPGHGEMDCTH